MALEFDPLHAIVEAVQALESDGRRILLVGAFARELTFDRALGTRPYRATRDVDAGVEVASWEAYDSLATRLVTSTRFHRLEPDGLTFVHEDGTQLDLLPFGGILDRSGLLRWPRNPSRTLSLHGFEAADESAIVVHIGNIVVRVAALPNLVALKLIAYRDRGQRTSKDLEDLDFIVNRASIVLHHRVFTELDGETLQELEYDNLGAHLLGQDMTRTMGAAEASSLVTIINTSILCPPEYLALGRTVGSSNLDRSIARFEALRAGLLHARRHEEPGANGHQRSR